MKRLRFARQAFGQPIEFIADYFGHSIATIEAWESGTESPTMAELRDLAMMYDTGIDDLEGDESLATRPVRTIQMEDKKGVDGYWGDLGIMLPSKPSYRWLPISATTARRIESAEVRHGLAKRQSNCLLVETLNNRLLWINAPAIRGLCLCPDAVQRPDAPGSLANVTSSRLAEIELDLSQLLPAVIYEVLTKRLRDDNWASGVSHRLRQEIEKELEAHRDRLSSDDLKRLLQCARLWMIDGSDHWIEASPASMTWAANSSQLRSTSGLLRLAGQHRGHPSIAVSLKQVAMIEFPAALVSLRVVD